MTSLGFLVAVVLLLALWKPGAEVHASGPLPFADALSRSESSDGQTSAIWTRGHEILLVDPSGSAVQKIGVHGAAPLFSQDGRYVAYEKLADVSADGDPQGLFEFAKGIAVYDLATDEEFLVTDGGSDDYAPIGFSDDFGVLYFNSTRPYEDHPGVHVASIWMVELATGETTRLTNLDAEKVRRGRMTPTINPSSALWSTDRTVVISSYGSEKGVWRFTISGEHVTADRIGDGDDPQWVAPDKTISVRTLNQGGYSRHDINLQ